MKTKIPLVLSLALASSVPTFAADTPDLDAGFANPPASARPRTWWHWVSGNVSPDGITADLQAMHNIGLAGLQNFTVDESDVHGPIKFMSPEWRNLVHYALTEAHRLNLDYGMEGCDGWSESGGPWITPDIAMQKIVFTERTLPGGHTIPLALPQPETAKDIYKDIALPATADDFPAPSAITSSAASFDGAKIIDSDPATVATLSAGQKGESRWIQFQFDHPVTAEYIHIIATGGSKQSYELLSSNDGQNFSHLLDSHRNNTINFAPVTATYFRLRVPPDSRNNAPALDFAEIQLAGKRLDKLPGQSGIEVDRHAGDFPNQSWPADQIIDPKSIVDLTGKTSWDAPPGNWTIVRIGLTAAGVTTHPSTAAGLECDKLSRAAVEAQFHGMFDPVFHDSPDLIGNTFTHILLDSWEAGCENWTPLMPADFKSRRGYDLFPYFPAFTGRIVGSREQTLRFFWDFRRTLADLVADNHYGTWRDMAHHNKLALYAEATGIGLPTVADQLQCKGRCDVPMGEFWINRSFDDNIDDPKEAASAAHTYGQNIAATESFTSTPNVAAWTNDPQSMKALGDFEFCQGVNRFIFHRYAHQPWLDRLPGMTMGPWGINFERTNTWWNDGSAWISYLSRCEFLLQQGRYAADILYFYGEGAPVTLNHRNLSPAPPAGYSYDVCNTEILNQLSVDHGDLILPSGMHYKLLVLPNSARMTLPTLQKIDALVAAGATIFGPRPTASPSLANFPHDDETIQQLAQKLWSNDPAESPDPHAGKILNGPDLAPALNVPPDFRSDPNLLFIHRTTPDADIYFLSNQQTADVVATCTFRVHGKAPELFHPDTGTAESPALYQSSADATTLPIHLDPVGSLFVIFRHPAIANPLAMVQRDGKILFDHDGDDDLPTVSPSGTPEFFIRRGGAFTFTSANGNAINLDTSLPSPITLKNPWHLTFPPNLGQHRPRPPPLLDRLP